MEFYNREVFREERKALGLTEQKLADRLGVHRTTVGHWERGTRTPNAFAGVRMAAILGIPLAKVLEDVQDDATAEAIKDLDYLRKRLDK